MSVFKHRHITKVKGNRDYFWGKLRRMMENVDILGDEGVKYESGDYECGFKRKKNISQIEEVFHRAAEHQ